MNILAIETSCDETSIALVTAKGGLHNPQFNIHKNIISSQIEMHRPFGGVVPMIAKREHIKNLPLVWKKFVENKNEIDAVAVTVGPGLAPALWQGVEFAKVLAKELEKPLIGVNHLEGHLLSFLAKKPTTYKLPTKNSPAIALIASGGHTILLHVESLTRWKKLGETRDDATGEAFDKVGKMLGLPYPGGPEIEKLALRQAQGKQKKGTIEFPRPMIHAKNYDFSFSGLKTAVLYYLRDMVNTTSDKKKRLTKKMKADVAASFQEAIVETLVTKTMCAVDEYKAKSIMLSGGVAGNKYLQKNLKQKAKSRKIPLLTAPMRLQTDNAGMIGIAAYITHLKKKSYKIEAQPNLNV
ncbi:MAG: tRNA (adenosine(37)-N6)-threonylcarbamoyltransferase complex transferase subunit TsaD [Candidatus Harrisonbacteria bacterium CG10_big_fil_rev_8_21_14_0_10_42_17]|uniref:tRNA N6-adenosine threonylcarbamoyltransferase n=1 Tax=Candidatus Harrisonbacteria bacterium CG10_big_fil_rev_8_21_14_0_10_42_17 TaxID=1974584 RepID=A0A2M6WGS9_9BACT|nr:MAG: tRNA (adenosine(37)-N6)-threonylcarbamoyltransferase complex transferase subunit TsaD [Candidatus Harrisonbacteria bacterium CG10_big_fil_rev_8_21_14_0_10_42_17]